MKWYGCYCNGTLMAVCKLAKEPKDNPETLRLFGMSYFTTVKYTFSKLRIQPEYYIDGEGNKMTYEKWLKFNRIPFKMHEALLERSAVLMPYDA